MRVTYKKGSKDIRKKALDQMRKLRARFEDEHPELLQRIRDEVGKQSLYDQAENTDNLQQSVVIDKKKNIQAVIAFAEQQSGSEQFQSRLKELLLQTLKD